jgi:hypothetical protein
MRTALRFLTPLTKKLPAQGDFLKGALHDLAER